MVFLSHPIAMWTAAMIISTVHLHLSLNDLHLSVFLFLPEQMSLRMLWKIHLRIVSFFLNASIIYCPITEWNVVESQNKLKKRWRMSERLWLAHRGIKLQVQFFVRKNGGRMHGNVDAHPRVFLADCLVAIHVHHTWLDDTHPLQSPMDFFFPL